MATLSQAIAFARAQSQTDSNGLTDTNAIIFANEALVDFHRRLVAAGVDASQLQEAYCNAAVPAAGNGATFLYPTDMLFLKTIEVNFTNTNAQDYKLATQVDVANLSAQSSFSWLRINGSTASPQFDDRGDWYEIFPAFTTAHNLTNAIRLFYYLKPTEYTSTADTIAYPESQDYRILGWRIAANYLYSTGASAGSARNLHLVGDTFNAKYEERVKQYIGTLSRGTQQPVQSTGLQITGFEF